MHAGLDHLVLQVSHESSLLAGIHCNQHRLTPKGPQAEVPKDVHVFQISLSARTDNILAGRPLVEASIFRQRNVPAASQSTPKGYALPGSRRGHSAQVWQRRAGAAAVPWPWCLRSGRRGQCCPPGHAVVNSRPGGATLRYSAFSAVGPLKIPFSLPSLGKKSCW